MSTTKFSFRLFILTIILTIVGCQGGCYHPGHGWVTSVKAIKENPVDYRKKGSATIKGTVTENITITGYSGYKLMDKNGETITVVGKGSRSIGEELYVTGHYETLLGLGKFSVDAFVMDE